MKSKVTRIMLASTGRTVKVIQREDDPTVSDIQMADGGKMTEAEWDEYVGLVVQGPQTVDTDDHGRYAIAFDDQGNPDQKDIDRVQDFIQFRSKIVAELQAPEVVTTGSEVANVS